MSEPLVIWRLTDGKPGHMQQTLGLAQALARLAPCRIIDIDLRRQRSGLLDFLRGRFPPGAGQPAPDFILGAGHATHLSLLAARRACGGQAIVLMKPSLPRGLFDLAVVPEHDAVAAGPRIVTTQGVLNPMRPGAKQAGSLLFLIGGPSKHVQWDDAAVLEQVAAVVATLASGQAWQITDSRRTPATLQAQLLQCYGERFQPHAHCPPGWLAARLAKTETVWVSEDSVSMVYEALTAGCRVGLLQLPAAAGGSRVMRGMARLQAAGRVAVFAKWHNDGCLPPVQDFDEATRVARLLLERRPMRERN